MQQERFHTGWTVMEKTADFGRNSTQTAKAVTLPHDAALSLPRVPEAGSGSKKAFYQNRTWEYTRVFDVPAEAEHEHLCFYFEGVYRHAAVFLNGDFAGQDSGGYSGFLVDADAFLRYGAQNRITVVARAGDDSRWYTGTGIYRGVYLLRGGLCRIEPFGVRVTTCALDDALAAVETAVTVKNSSAAAKKTLRVEITLTDPDGRPAARGSTPVTVLRGEAACTRQRLYIEDPLRWSPETPALYTCRVRLLDADGACLDTDEVQFGLRTLALDPVRGLQLNGQTVKLRGACIHHDNGPLGAAEYDRAQLRRIGKLKDAGFNAVRMAHGPASPALLRACDRLGMLVMDEAFDMWTESKCNDDYSLDFPQWWQRDLTAMVQKDYNHPCVILYSIGNEIPEAGSAAGAVWARKLAEQLRQLDGTRYLINCVNGMVAVKLLNVMRLKLRDKARAAAVQAAAKDGCGEINTVMNTLGAAMKEVMTMDEVTLGTEEAFSCVDVAGYNYMNSRYEADRLRFPNRVICGSETYTPDIDRNWRLVRENSHVIGDFCWSGWDYLGEAGIGRVTYGERDPGSVYGTYPNLMSMTGDFDITGFRRPASYYRQIVFGLRKDPYIAVQRPEHYGQTAHMSTWSWSDSVSSWSWDGFEGKPVRVEVYADADEVALLLGDTLLARGPGGEAVRYLTRFDVPYTPGVLTAVAYRNGREIGRYSLRSAEKDAVLALRADRTEISGDGTEPVYVELAVTDAAGIVRVTDARKIALTLEGPGELLGFGTGDPAPEEEFTSSVRTTFDGRALAVVRALQPGRITLTARAEGLEPKTLQIEAV